MKDTIISAIYRKYMLKYDNGLLLVNVNTSQGKSYARDIILKEVLINDSFWKELGERRILSITPMKNNLNIGEFKKFGIDNGIIDFSKKFVFLDSMILAVSNNSNLAEYANKYFLEYPELNTIFQLSQSLKDVKDKAVKDALNSRIVDCEYSLRNKIKAMLSRDKKYRHISSPKLRAEYVINNYPWISDLYPIINIYTARVIVLSLKKFTNIIDPIVSAPFFFWDSEIVEGAVAFWDEFDSCNKDLLGSFSNVFNSNWDEMAIIKQLNIVGNKLSYVKNLPSEISNSKAYRKLANKIIAEINDFYDKYQLDIAYIRSDELIKNSDKNNFFKSSNPRSDAEINKLKLVFSPDSKTIEEDSMVPSGTVCHDINEVLNRANEIMRLVCDFVNRLSKELTFDDALDIKFAGSRINCLKSILKEIGVVENQDVFISNILNYSLARDTDKISGSLYLDGFSISSVEENFDSRFSSLIKTHKLDMTPEKFLCILADKCLVIGLSATAEICSTIANFDLDFVQKYLGSKFYSLNKTEKENISNEYYNKNKDFVDSGILKTVILPDNYSTGGETIESYNYIIKLLLTNNVSSKDLADFKNIISGLLEYGSYYVNIFFSMLFYIEEILINEDMAVSLIVGNNTIHKYANNSSIFTMDIMNQAIEIIARSRKINKKINVFSLAKDGCSEEEFEIKKAEALIHRPFNKTFIFSTYATVGAGQTFSIFVDDKKKFYKKFGDVDKPYKDLDSILLINPTRIVSNNYNNLSEKIEVIYMLKSLCERGEILETNCNEMIRKVLDNDSLDFSILSICNSYKQAIVREIKQAVGRLSRNPYKNKTMRIYIQEKAHTIVLNNYSENVPSIEMVSVMNGKKMEYLERFYSSTRQKTMGCTKWYDLVKSEIAKYRKKEITSNFEYYTIRVEKALLEYPSTGKKALNKLCSRFPNMGSLYAERDDNGMRMLEYLKKVVGYYSKNPKLKKIIDDFVVFPKETTYILTEEGVNLFLGHLGEVLLDEILKDLKGVEIVEMESSKYELVDTCIRFNGFEFYLDAKNYATTTDKYKNEILFETRKKAKKLGKDAKVIVINLRPLNVEKYQVIQEDNICIIPAFIDSNGHIYYEKLGTAMKKLCPEVVNNTVKSSTT